MSLYRTFLREGGQFPNYNIREYILRKAKHSFRHNADAPADQVAGLVEKATGELEVLRRQAMVYEMYHSKHKSVMDMPPPYGMPSS